jgi:hypothetical protein
MKPQIFIVLLVVGLVAVLGVAFYTGAVSFPSKLGFGSDGLFNNLIGDDPLDPNELPEDPEDPVVPSIDTLTLTDREILQALEYLTGKNLPEGSTMPYISSLHMQAYGVNGLTAYDLLTYYEEKNSNDGYTSYTTFVDNHPGYTSYNEVWYQGINGRGVSTADGASINSFYGYDTMCLTSYGPLTEYQNLWVIINAAPPL